MKRKFEVQIDLTIDEIAEAFCNMTASQQAEFFGLIDSISSTWDNSLAVQLQSVMDSKLSTKGGRHVMRLIGEYSGD